MTKPFFYYKAFGLIFKSCIEHPQFIAIAEVAQPDCAINFGVVSNELADPEKTGAAFQIKGKQFLLRIENVGRYLIQNGDTITIDSPPDVSQREIIIFLWASAVAALLHQRGMLIIHGSAIMADDKAIIFSGRSGSGKSTLASAICSLKNGLIISDDLCAIRLNSENMPIVLPGYPIMKFWPDSSEKLGMEWDESLIFRTNVNKMVVDIRDRFVQHEVPLSQFYHLSYKNEGSVSITGINGYKKLEVLMGKIFRKNYLKKDGADHAAVFLEASKIVPYMRICTIERQHGISFLDETINAIQQDLM